MKVIYKFFLSIPLFLLWIIVYLMFMEKRNEYYLAKQKNAKHIKTEHKYGIVSEHYYYFDSTKQPQREYPTWSEFWKRFGY